MTVLRREAPNATIAGEDNPLHAGLRAFVDLENEIGAAIAMRDRFGVMRAA